MKINLNTDMKKLALLTLGILSALTISSCSVCSHVSVADFGRSAEAILLPLEQPTLHSVNGKWYMEGQKTYVERHNAPWVRPEQLPDDKRHPERYSIDSDELSPVYAAIPAEMAESIRKGKYTHSQAISFINRKWVDTLPEGKVQTVKTKAAAPDYFRKMSSHRLLQTETSSYLLAHIGEFTADFSSILAYPLAGLCTIVVDTPASFFYSPPTKKKQVAQPEELD